MMAYTLLIAAAAPAADPYAGAFIAGCRQGGCSWTKVLSVRTVSKTGAGVLKVETSLVGESDHRGADSPSVYSRAIPIAWEKKPVETYVFCSRKQPSIAFQDRWSGKGAWFGHLLDPFETYGYNEGSARTYIRVCHGARALDQLDRPALLRSLGYRPGTRNEQVDLRAPTDLLKVPPPRPAR